MKHFNGLSRALALLAEEAQVKRKVEIARRGKIPVSSVTRVINDGKIPELATLDGWLTALGKTPHDLARALDIANGRTPPLAIEAPPEVADRARELLKLADDDETAFLVKLFRARELAKTGGGNS